MHTVDIQNISKAYGKFVAVDDLSFTISPGTIFGLLGPNGAGKTSTIRMMIGITAPDSGNIQIFGQPFQRQHLHRIGYLPEERGLYKKMKVIDQLVLMAELHGVSAADANARSRKWCEQLDLTEWLRKKVEELSKGMQQKVQFIAAMVHDPDLIIMDEPFAGLDPINSALLKNVLLEQRRAGKTILFSTHRMDQVEKMCDAICLVNHGKTVLSGSLRPIQEKYGKSLEEIFIDVIGKSDA